MADGKLIRLAERWRPDPDDPDGVDKQRLVEFLLKSEASCTRPIPIDRVLRDVQFTRRYTRNGFQHRLLSPLRKRRDIFIGTGSTGIFLVTSAEDADRTLGFYTARVRAELRHARNLRNLARRTKLFKSYRPDQSKKRSRAVIFIDESGVPTTRDLDPPVFVVAAVILESKAEVAELPARFANASAIIKRPPEHELKTKGLSVAKHRTVLRELSLVDYQWAAACFRKDQLHNPGFADAATFYRYAFQFLVGELLTIAWEADLVIDEYSTADFQQQLAAYLRDQNSGLPVNRLNEIKFASSAKERLTQLADLVAGAIRRAEDGESGPLDQIGDKMLNVQYWPPD